MIDRIIGHLLNGFAFLLFCAGMVCVSAAAICAKGAERPSVIVAAFAVGALMIVAGIVIAWLSEEALYG